MKKKILFVITKSETGGAQKFVYEQVLILSDSYECYIATNKEGWLTEVSRSNIKGYLLQKEIEKISFKYLKSLRKFIKNNHIDLVICNSANGGGYGRLAAFLSGTKSIYVSHGWSSVYNGGRLSFIYNFIEKVLGAVGSSVLCISKNDWRIAKTKIGIPESKLHQLNNAIFPYNSSLSAANRNFSQKIYKLLTIARLASPKRIDLLIEAVRELPNVELTIVGDGPQKADLINIIKSESQQNVVLKGEVKSFKDFNDYDMFALISESEGLPMSAIEAMSFGLPLILSDVGGCSELINNSGVLVNNNVLDIKAGILQCVSSIAEYSTASHNNFTQNFNLLNNQQSFKIYYDDIITK